MHARLRGVDHPDSTPDSGSHNSAELQIPKLLRALSAGERRLAEAVAVDLGTSATDLIALGDLLSGERLGPTDLGRRLGLSSAAATGLADRLEALGHVERRPHPKDRRRLVLAPTPHGKTELLARLAPIVAATEALVANLTADQQATVARFLRDVVALHDRETAAMTAATLAARDSGVARRP